MTKKILYVIIRSAKKEIPHTGGFLALSKVAEPKEKVKKKTREYELNPSEQELIEHRTPIKKLSVTIASKFAFAGADKEANKICDCCGALFLYTYDLPDIGKKTKYESYHCHIRLCPNCIKRREQRMRAIAYQALENLIQDHVNMRFFMLTLTYPNCDIDKLKDTLSDMSRAWNKFIGYSAIERVVRGFARSVEVTPGKETNPDGSRRLNRVHPHYHVLVAVDSGYFVGRKYIKQAKWLQLWRKATRLPSITQVDVRMIYNRETKKKIDYKNSSEVVDAVREAVKYEIKYSDLEQESADYILTLHHQLKGKRFSAFGGLIAEYLTKYRRIKRGKAFNELVDVMPSEKELIAPYLQETSLVIWKDKYIKIKTDKFDEGEFDDDG